MYIVIPTWVMITFAILAWLGVVYHFWFKPHYLPKLDNYFAQRRHDRRTRNYMRRDAQLTLSLYKKPKKVLTHASARHRR